MEASAWVAWIDRMGAVMSARVPHVRVRAGQGLCDSLDLAT